MGVRVLGADDWETKRRLRLWALKESPRSFGSTYGREKNRSEAQWRTWPDAGVFFAAGRRGEDVGIACGWRTFRDPAATELISMWVVPHMRGQRIGVDLIDAVVDWARAARTDRIELEVADDNEAALKLCLRYGFVPSASAAPAGNGLRRRLPPQRRTGPRGAGSRLREAIDE